MRIPAVLAVVLSLGACTVSNDEPLSEAERAWVDDAMPAFQASCVSCHGSKAPDDPIGWLAGETEFESRLRLLMSGLVDASAPISESPLLAKGLHEGPALTVEQAAAIIRWLEAEAAQQ